MDTVVIVNKHVDRSDMFADLYVRLCARKDVKDLVKVLTLLLAQSPAHETTCMWGLPCIP